MKRSEFIKSLAVGALSIAGIGMINTKSFVPAATTTLVGSFDAIGPDLNNLIITRYPDYYLTSLMDKIGEQTENNKFSWQYSSISRLRK